MLMPAKGGGLDVKSNSDRITIERDPSITVESVDLGELLADKSRLAQLKYNVVTGSEEEGVFEKMAPVQRRPDLTRMAAEKKGAQEKELTYVAKKGDDILGLLHISFDGSEAKIEHFWSAKPQESQQPIVNSLVLKAYEELPERPERSYGYLIVDTGEEGEVSKPLSHTMAALSRFLRRRASGEKQV
jgi:hypothetical protein